MRSRDAGQRQWGAIVAQGDRKYFKYLKHTLQPWGPAERQLARAAADGEVVYHDLDHLKVDSRFGRFVFDSENDDADKHGN